MNANLLSVDCIWNQAPHSAFTSLVRYQGRFFCVFREGTAHVSNDGTLRILTSLDGSSWESAASISSPHATLTDMRDGKLHVLPDGRLGLIGAAAQHGERLSRQSYAWFSADGHRWSSAVEIGEKDIWVWDLASNGDSTFAVGYGIPDSPQAEAGILLYEELVSHGPGEGLTIHREPTCGPQPLRDSETALLFHRDQGLAIIRREFSSPQDLPRPLALLGTATPPYRDWSWKEVNYYVGGPKLFALPNGRLLLGGRRVSPELRTVIWELDLASGHLVELLELPSSGDNSYPGFVWHQDLLWMSYYSSHEGKTQIYLAKIHLTATS